MAHASNESKHTYTAEIVQWLETQPRNGIVAWTSPHIRPEEPFPTGFVDIEVPELLEKLGVMWLWTIVDPQDQDQDELTIVLEKDPDQGWSPDQISRGIEQWLRSRSRRTDIQFQWDPEIPSKMISVVEEAERQSTAEPDIQIGEGLYASAQAMDALLQMPIDNAAEVTRVMQAVADEHRPDA
jgi:hypothetical protein